MKQKEETEDKMMDIKSEAFLFLKKFSVSCRNWNWNWNNISIL